ncbi:MAG: hypothetical protein AAGJ94_07475 [Pseudomonadota bacterium]
MTDTRKDNRTKPRLGFFDFFAKWTSDETVKISQEEIEYFTEHPDEIDDFASPIRLHKLFLLIGMTIGVLGVAVAKVLTHSGLLSALPEGVVAFITDIVFEVGVALIGASIVTFMMGIVMNRQQKNALKWRDDIRKRINEGRSKR